MAIVPKSKDAEIKAVELHNGDKMTREQFHYAYERMPREYRAELIGGMVFEPPSPLGWAHGEHDARIGTLFGIYSGQTLGVEVAHNATVMLSDQDELQPDVTLRINAKTGGQSKLTLKGYVAGPPELVAEIAFSSRAIDLHLKKERYSRGGVLEYIVVCLEPLSVHWFNLRTGEQLEANKKDILRSNVFPGLWIHRTALLQLDYEGSMKALNQGLRTAEYKAFKAGLSKHKR